MRKFELIEVILRIVRQRAWESGWEKEELKKSLRMAEQIVELMDNVQHLGKPSPIQQDYRTHPTVVAVPLEMAAELAYRHDLGLDGVKKYALRLMNALKQQNFMAASFSNQKSCSSLTDHLS